MHRDRHRAALERSPHSRRDRILDRRWYALPAELDVEESVIHGANVDRRAHACMFTDATSIAGHASHAA
jgi:hypothetical protein